MDEQMFRPGRMMIGSFYQPGMGKDPYLVQLRCSLPPYYRVCVIWARSTQEALSLARHWKGGSKFARRAHPEFVIEEIYGAKKADVSPGIGDSTNQDDERATA